MSARIATLALTLVAWGQALAQAPVPFSGPPAQLAFTNPERRVIAGRCSEPLVVSLLDSNGVPAVAEASTTVTLSSALASPDAGILFFPDAGCGCLFSPDAGCSWAPSDRGDIPAGGSAATFTLMGTSTGRYQVIASAPGLASATQELELVPDAPAMVQFTSGPFTVDAGECSPPLTFHLMDWYGNLSPPDAGVEIFAFVSTGNVSLYSDPGCAEPLASAVISPPDAGGVLHFQSFVPQRFIVSLGAVGLTGGFQQEIIYGEHAVVTLNLSGQAAFAGSEQRIEVLVSNLGSDTLSGAQLRLEVHGLSLSDPGPIPLPAIPFLGTAQLGRAAVVTGTVGSTFSVRGRVENAAGEPIGPEADIRRLVFPMVADIGSSCGGCAAGGSGPWAAAALALALLLRRRPRA